MKYLLPIIVFLLLIVACTSTTKDNSNRKVKTDTLASISNEIELPQEKVDTIIDLKDTTFHFSTYSVNVEAVDSVEIPNLYSDAAVRENILNNYDNSYEAFKGLEEYLKKTQSMYFKRNGKTLTLSLVNGKTKELKDISKDSDDDILYTYEHFFSNINTYLVRGQFFEGNCYIVINRNTGEEKYTIGEIYVAPQNQKFIAINEDMEAGYSSNGLQMFEIKNEKFIKKFTIEGGSWGPIALKWINDSSVIMKAHIRTGVDDYSYITKFYKLTFQ